MKRRILGGTGMSVSEFVGEAPADTFSSRPGLAVSAMW
jgi:hypothetical protein